MTEQIKIALANLGKELSKHAPIAPLSPEVKRMVQHIKGTPVSEFDFDAQLRADCNQRGV